MGRSALQRDRRMVRRVTIEARSRALLAWTDRTLASSRELIHKGEALLAQLRMTKGTRSMKRSHIGIRCTVEQKDMLQSAADKVGLPLSVWLKMLGLLAAGCADLTELQTQLAVIERLRSAKCESAKCKRCGNGSKPGETRL